jgi:hypothetical protein
MAYCRVSQSLLCCIRYSTAHVDYITIIFFILYCRKGNEEAAETEGDKKDDEATKKWDQIELKKSYRKFNIDLAPKVSI